AGQGGDADLEPGGPERGPGPGHQIPGLVRVQVHLAPSCRAGTQQWGKGPLEPEELVPQASGGLGVSERPLDRQERSVSPRTENGQQPCSGLVRLVEPDREDRPVTRSDGGRPSGELGRYLPGGSGRCREGRAVETG